MYLFEVCLYSCGVVQQILIDIHQVRKDINATSEALGRAFTATDERVYVEARKGEPAVKQLYREIVDLHDVRTCLVAALCVCVL